VSAPAPTLEAFFTQRLVAQRNASPHTIASYRDCFRLLLGHVQITTGIAPTKLDFADLDAKVVAGFLDHLEAERNVTISTRNARLAASTRCSVSLRSAIPNTPSSSLECSTSPPNEPGGTLSPT
jgi:Phage integrase, N-terminal SAM-like domain